MTRPSPPPPPRPSATGRSPASGVGAGRFSACPGWRPAPAGGGEDKPPRRQRCPRQSTWAACTAPSTTAWTRGRSVSRRFGRGNARECGVPIWEVLDDDLFCVTLTFTGPAFHISTVSRGVHTGLLRRVEGGPNRPGAGHHPIVRRGRRGWEGCKSVKMGPAHPPCLMPPPHASFSCKCWKSKGACGGA